MPTSCTFLSLMPALTWPFHYRETWATCPAPTYHFIQTEVDPIIRTTGSRPLDGGRGSLLTLGAVDFPRCLIAKALMWPIEIVVVEEAI